MGCSRSFSIALRGIRGGDHEATAAGCATGLYEYSRSWTSGSPSHGPSALSAEAGCGCRRPTLANQRGAMTSAGPEIWYPRVVPMGPITD
jgi:hypothetical protein